MSAGTITLTNNSATVTGSGTAFTSELTVGDFIAVTVGGIPYTLPIKTVNSNTSLTLVSNYTGPTQGGAAWYAVPRVAMNLVTAALVAQSAEALRGLNYDKQNWQRLFSTSGNITVTLPDGSSFTGPSWQYMVNTVATKTNGAVPVNQGGTGATNAEDARTNFGLGTAALKNYVSGRKDDVMLQGYGNLIVLSRYNPDLPLFQTGVYGESSPAGWKPTTAGSGFVSGYDSVRRQQYWISTQGGFYVRHIEDAAYNIGANVYPWTQMQAVGTSDIDFKKDITELDTEIPLANIDAMEFVSFRYKGDDSEAVRRGVIAQQIEKIDPEYVHSAEGVGKMTLDLNPLLMDALAAIKALNAKVSELSKQVDELKQGVAWYT